MVEFAYGDSTVNLDMQQVQHRTVVRVTGAEGDVRRMNEQLMAAAGKFTLITAVQDGGFNFDPTDLMKAASRREVSKENAVLVSDLHDAVVGDFKAANAEAVKRVMLNPGVKAVEKFVPEGAAVAVVERMAQDMVGLKQRMGDVLASDQMVTDATPPAVARAQLTMKMNDVPVENWRRVIDALVGATQRVKVDTTPESLRMLRAAADYVARGNGQADFGPAKKS